MNTQANTLCIPSDLNQLYKVDKFVEDICDHYNINNNYFGNIIMVLTEAVSNAIIHGNQSNPEKKVKIHFQSGASGLSFTIEDEGAGFDAQQVPDPTDLNVEFKEGLGTGIFLMRSLSDQLEFLDHGKKTVVLFKISSINYELSVQRSQAILSYFQQEKFLHKGNQYE